MVKEEEKEKEMEKKAERKEVEEKNEGEEKVEKGEEKKEEGEEKEQAKPKIDISKLSSLERSVYDTVGEEGIIIFRIADGRMTLEKAAEKLGISMDKVKDLINKMEGKFIRVETERSGPEEGVKVSNEEKVLKKYFEPVDIPKKVDINPISFFAISSEIAIQFGPSAKKLFDIIDGKLDTIQLAATIETPLDYVDSVMWFLADKKALKFTTLKLDEIKQKYGRTGLKIYREFGREGLLLYILLSKFSDPIYAIKSSGIEPIKGVEVYEFIYNLLSPQFTLNKKELLEKLSIG